MYCYFVTKRYQVFHLDLEDISVPMEKFLLNHTSYCLVILHLYLHKLLKYLYWYSIIILSLFWSILDPWSLDNEVSRSSSVTINWSIEQSLISINSLCSSWLCYIVSELSFIFMSSTSFPAQIFKKRTFILYYRLIFVSSQWFYFIYREFVNRYLIPTYSL